MRYSISIYSRKSETNTDVLDTGICFTSYKGIEEYGIIKGLYEISCKNKNAENIYNFINNGISEIEIYNITKIGDITIFTLKIDKEDHEYSLHFKKNIPDELVVIHDDINNSNYYTYLAQNILKLLNYIEKYYNII